MRLFSALLLLGTVAPASAQSSATASVSPIRIKVGDLDRVLVLRAAINFDIPRGGQSAAESLAATKIGHYTAYLPALDTAYRLGHVVVDSIVEHWSEDRDHLPANGR